MAQDLRSRVIEALRTVYDPEIPVNIYELGSDLRSPDRRRNGEVLVKMTLTAPNCPVAEIMPNQVKQKVLASKASQSAKIDLVFDPPWDRDKMSDGSEIGARF